MRIKILFNLGLLVLPFHVLAMEQLHQIAPEERLVPLSRVVTLSACQSFHAAVVADNLAIVKSLLDTEITVNQKLDRMVAGQTAMHFAAKCGHADIIEELLNRGADINVQDATGQTPLFCAALHGRQAAVKLLLKAGADPNITIRNFEQGINYKHLLRLQRVKRSTRRGFYEIPIESYPKLYDSALKVALKSRSEHNIAIVHRLLAYGAQPGACMDDCSIQTDAEWNNCIHHYFRKAILREKPDHLCFEELTNTMSSTHPVEVKRGVACAAARGRTSLLKELPNHLYRLPNSVKDINQFLAPLYSHAFYIAALRGHNSTAAFLFPYATQKQITESCNTVKNLLQFATLSDNQRNSYEKVLIPILLRTMDQDMQTTYFGKLPRGIRDMVSQYYTEQNSMVIR